MKTRIADQDRGPDTEVRGARTVISEDEHEQNLRRRRGIKEGEFYRAQREALCREYSQITESVLDAALYEVMARIADRPEEMPAVGAAGFRFVPFQPLPGLLLMRMFYRIEDEHNVELCWLEVVPDPDEALGNGD